MKQLSLFTSEKKSHDRECILNLLAELEQTRRTKKTIHNYVERYEFGNYPQSMRLILEKLRRVEHSILVTLREVYEYNIWDIIDYSKPFYK